MADPYLSEIYIFPFDWAPISFARCDGQLMTISQNQALYGLLGTIWGGDGRNTFGIPDLRGRVPIFYDNFKLQLSKKGGEETAQATLPYHTHTLIASTEYGDQFIPDKNYLSVTRFQDATDFATYAPVTSFPPRVIKMSPNTCSYVGSGEKHNNMQPSLVLNFCIATSGTWPSRG